MFFKSRQSVSELAVIQALSQVRDPDLGKDIVSLGFIKNLQIREGEVRFDVELTTPACPVKEQLKLECEERVRAVAGVTGVEATMTSQVRATAASGGNRIQLPSIRNLIAVASGKGGVGKSTVTVNLAAALATKGARVGLLDADIYGPSIPLMMGSHERPLTDGQKVVPISKYGVRVMSMGFLIPEDQPVVWRGPMVHGALTQFLTQVDWGELDYLLIDMPPGTGDAQLTISQIAPLSGAVIVTTPQDVSLIDARKGLMMFQKVSVPILGVIENMAGFVCSHCNEVTPIFGQGGGEKIAREMAVPFLGSVPIDPRVVACGDSGNPAVNAFPDSEVAKRFTRLAQDMAARLSIQQAQSTGAFKPLSMEWQ